LSGDLLGGFQIDHQFKLILFIYGTAGGMAPSTFCLPSGDPAQRFRPIGAVEHQSTGDNKISAAVGSSLPL
jgi:hypothetical protein